MNRASAAALKEPVSLKSKWHKRQKEDTVTSYCEAVNNGLATYTTQDIMDEAYNGMMQFTQPSNKSPTKYSEALWNKAITCNRVYDENVLKRHLMRYCRNT